MKLGELATVRSGLVLSRKQACKGAPVKMRYPLLSFRAIHSNGYIGMEQLDGFDAAEQLSPEYLTQVGDVIIRLTSPYTAVLIDEASAGMVVSSNFVIIRVDRNRLLPGYLVWLINTPKIRKAIYENTSSNMLGAINAKFFSEFEIHPPAAENRRTVSAGEKGDGAASPVVGREGALLRSADPQCTFDHEMRYAP